MLIAGLPMMLGAGKPDKQGEPEDTGTGRDMAVIPMTFPMSIGGTTAAYIVSAAGFATNALDLLAISAVVVIFGVAIWLTHLFSPPLAARLSPQARLVLNRGGIILVAISEQLMANGLEGLFPSPA